MTEEKDYNMTVGELKRALAKYPIDARVEVWEGVNDWIYIWRWNKADKKYQKLGEILLTKCYVVDREA